MNTRLSELQELVMDREAWRAAIMELQRVVHDWATELNWTEAKLLPGSVAAEVQTLFEEMLSCTEGTQTEV